MYAVRRFVDAGGLMSYDAVDQDLLWRAAAYVDKILRGSDPADLPVEQPTKFEWVINLKAAKQIDVTIPQELLYRADWSISTKGPTLFQFRVPPKRSEATSR